MNALATVVAAIQQYAWVKKLIAPRAHQLIENCHSLGDCFAIRARNDISAN